MGGVRGRRKGTAGFFLVAGTAVVVLAALGNGAFACTNLAQINLSATAGRPGDAIVITGSGFMGSLNDASMADMGMDDMNMGEMKMGSTSGLAIRPPVTLHWDGADGPVLGTAIPDKSGSISVLFNIPDAKPGHYTVLAVQKNAQGFDVYGTPARAPFEVTPSGRPTSQPVYASTAGTGTDSSPLTLIVLTAGLGVLSVGLFVAGGIAVARHRARRRVAVPT